MKLPAELDPRRKNTMFTLSDIEAIVRDCAKVLEAKHNELATRSYPPPTILLELRDTILARYGLEAE